MTCLDDVFPMFLRRAGGDTGCSVVIVVATSGMMASGEDTIGASGDSGLGLATAGGDGEYASAVWSENEPRNFR